MTTTEDHFNWPMPSKKDTMYLSTIKKSEAGFQEIKVQRDTCSLDIRDIDKAQPFYPGYHYTNKESYVNRNDDISGSHPKKLHQPLNKEYYGLRNDDIKGSKPQSHKFVTTRQPTDPLNPEYRLPQVEIRVSTPPKFVRDQMDIKDIDGARPNPYFKYNIERKNLTVDDIDGARPKKEWIPQGKQNSLDVRDINYFWEFHTKRSTNPLSPRYKIPDEDKKLFEYGKLDNKSIIRHPEQVHKETSLSLKTQDIIGAQAGTAVEHIHKISTRDDLLKTGDIPGAQISTLKKGMSTMRHVNPLNPSYTLPGHSEPTPVFERNSQPSKPVKPTRNAMVNSGINKVGESQVQSQGQTQTSQYIPSNYKTQTENVRKSPPGITGSDVKFFDGNQRIPTPLQTSGQNIVGGTKKPPSSGKDYSSENNFYNPKSHAEKFDQFIK